MKNLGVAIGRGKAFCTGNRIVIDWAAGCTGCALCKRTTELMGSVLCQKNCET